MANTEKHESSSLLNDEYVEPSPTQNFKKGFIEITKSPRDL